MTAAHATGARDTLMRQQAGQIARAVFDELLRDDAFGTPTVDEAALIDHYEGCPVCGDDDALEPCAVARGWAV